MFRTDAFGRRINCMPRLRFSEGEGGGGGETEEQKAARIAAEEAAFLAENGFPHPRVTSTRLAELPAEQQALYWKSEAKKAHKEKAAPTDYEDLKAAKSELDALKKSQLSDQEKALEEAREEARREGENIGSERYLHQAVTARFQLLTGKSDDDVKTAFDIVDPKKFLDDKGEILADKLEAFAATFGLKSDAGKGNEDPVAAALARQRAAGGGTGSSISDKRKEVRESMTKPKA